MGKLSITKPLSLCTFLLACGAQAQHLERVYNRDTHESFTLKDVESKAVVKGPIVKQETVFSFDNPFTKLTEASVWFDLDQAAILSDFGYWYKDEYVPGVLMDKNKAWFIYTAITSRNEDPGIMVQTSPSSYHAQVYPLAVGHDFRVKLTSVGFLQPKDDTFVVPSPSFDGTQYEQTVESAHPETLQVDTSSTPPKNTVVYPKEGPLDMQVYAQKHRDGYTYVAGMLRTDKPDAKLKVKGIRKVYWTSPDDGSTKLFIGRRRGSGKVEIVTRDRSGSTREAKVIKANERGSDTAKLWAHQRLVQERWMNRRDVLNFSLKYQIPSSQTALLAVPQEQMKLFKKKAAEYRRQQAEEARRERAWQRNRRQNWSRSSGGDPEIRVYEPQATRVYAVLPDGRSFDLTKSRGGFWGGNYDIPADAPEGEYVVKIYAVNAAGETTEQSVSYQVDRTAPIGTLRMEDGFLVLSSEKDLARVVVVFGDGKEENMVQVEPGLYKLATGARRIVKVMMIDQAHNLGEVRWSN